MENPFVKNPMDLVKYRWLFTLFSIIIIGPGLLFIALGGLRPSIDFTGGSSWEIYFDPQRTPSGPEVVAVLEEAENRFIGQLKLKPENTTGPVEQNLLSSREQQRFVGVAQESEGGLIIVRTSLISDSTGEKDYLTQALNERFGKSNGFNPDRLSLISAGPTIAAETTVRSALAVLAASGAILLYLAYAFRKVKNPWRYGACAIFAMLHDAVLVIGVFAILGYFFGIEVDALFVTALLTTIGFSVHDSIVVFDRIRENQLRFPGERFDSLVNHSILQTLVRSVNTSLTILFTLLALYLFGGASIRNFVLALIIGIASGTYSSIFNASMLLVIWEKGELRRFLPFLPRSKNKKRVNSLADYS
jgi:preprotein translocase subunit SecF